MAQEPSALFLKVRTDVTVDVRRHSTGADLVEITMRDPAYPAALLQSQVEKMCESIGVPARGLSVGRSSLDPNAPSFVRASFATNGIIEGSGAYHTFRIEPILKAFAGAAAPYRIEGLSIEFEGELPSAKTIKRFSLPNVLMAEGRFTDSGPLAGIEYRVQLLSQDPNRIRFPDVYQAEPRPAPPPQPARPEGRSERITLVVLILCAGIAAGALVYFAMLRTGSRARY